MGGFFSLYFMRFPPHIGCGRPVSQPPLVILILWCNIAENFIGYHLLLVMNELILHRHAQIPVLMKPFRDQLNVFRSIVRAVMQPDDRAVMYLLLYCSQHIGG